MEPALFIEWAIKSIIIFLGGAGGFAYLTLYERRALARIQTRIGPNRAGPFGLLQPVADGIKLIFNEELIPDKADKLTEGPARVNDKLHSALSTTLNRRLSKRGSICSPPISEASPRRSNTTFTSPTLWSFSRDRVRVASSLPRSARNSPSPVTTNLFPFAFTPAVLI